MSDTARASGSLSALRAPALCTVVTLSSSSMEMRELMVRTLAPQGAVCLVSAPCPSCSVIQKIHAALLLVMTIHTGCPLTHLCLQTWFPSRGTGWLTTLAGVQCVKPPPVSSPSIARQLQYHSVPEAGNPYGLGTRLSCKQVQEQKDPPSPWFLLAHVWKISAKCPLSSVTAGERVTTTLIPIATGWPPSTQTTCSVNQFLRQ